MMRTQLVTVAVWLTTVISGTHWLMGADGFHSVSCEGTYAGHLQGVCTDNDSAIYWSFTTQLVKTDRDGHILKQIPVGSHHGDACYYNGRVYVAVNFGKFNDPQGNADSWVYVYNADDLSLIAKHETQQVVHGAGGIAYHAGKFLVVGGLPDGVQENYLYEFDPEFNFVKKHNLKSGWTQLGIQTATFADGQWWFGCYGTPKILLVTDESFEHVQRYEFDCSLGIVPIDEGRFLIASGTRTKEGHTGRLEIAVPDEKHGLVVQQDPKISFDQQDDRVLIRLGDVQIAEYVFRDENTLRPYFRHLCTPSGVQVTRTHPPEEGSELSDHATMHPGLWMAFGDISGHDFWRNKARVRNDGIVDELTSSDGRGSFTVNNAYEADGETVCREKCHIEIEQVEHGWLLRWTSTFTSDHEFAFGDQEEMGLGVRVATPLAVKKGGRIINSDGLVDEEQVWGKQADWCTYGGEIDGHNVNLTLMPHPDNFRRSWFHARDYGLLLANPFGRKAFTKGEPSRVIVKPGESLTLRFGVLVSEAQQSPDVSSIYREYVGE
ncbi:MAG: PmoA family protein [Planctomycetaceae bacterium]|nr:PmoA family protein [Planctomycetaceae bacterium]